MIWERSLVYLQRTRHWPIKGSSWRAKASHPSSCTITLNSLPLATITHCVITPSIKSVVFLDRLEQQVCLELQQTPSFLSQHSSCNDESAPSLSSPTSEFELGTFSSPLKWSNNQKESRNFGGKKIVNSICWRASMFMSILSLWNYKRKQVAERDGSLTKSNSF